MGRQAAGNPLKGYPHQRLQFKFHGIKAQYQDQLQLFKCRRDSSLRYGLKQNAFLNVSPKSEIDIILPSKTSLKFSIEQLILCHFFISKKKKGRDWMRREKKI